MKYFIIGIFAMLGAAVIFFTINAFESGRQFGQMQYRYQYVKALKEMYPECRKSNGYLTAEPFPGGKMLIGCAHFRNVDNNVEMRDHEFIVYEGQI